MNAYTDKAQESKSQSAASATSQQQNGGKSDFQFTDNRPEAIAQRRLQALAKNSRHTKQLKAFLNVADNSPQVSHTTQLQMMARNGVTKQELVKNKENNTGLPDLLKTGIENLSGMSLNDVKVHRNSNKPAQLQAHAFAQGTNIHLAPGQEKHLPHEAWHVVQQKQGRVKPTLQLKDNVNINDDEQLEREADAMALEALKSNSRRVKNSLPLSNADLSTESAVQRVVILNGQRYGSGGLPVDQLQRHPAFARMTAPAQTTILAQAQEMKTIYGYHGFNAPAFLGTRRNVEDMEQKGAEDKDGDGAEGKSAAGKGEEQVDEKAQDKPGHSSVEMAIHKMRRQYAVVQNTHQNIARAIIEQLSGAVMRFKTAKGLGKHLDFLKLLTDADCLALEKGLETAGKMKGIKKYGYDGMKPGSPGAIQQTIYWYHALKRIAIAVENISKIIVTSPAIAKNTGIAEEMQEMFKMLSHEKSCNYLNSNHAIVVAARAEQLLEKLQRPADEKAAAAPALVSLDAPALEMLEEAGEKLDVEIFEKTKILVAAVQGKRLTKEEAIERLKQKKWL